MGDKVPQSLRRQGQNAGLLLMLETVRCLEYSGLSLVDAARPEGACATELVRAQASFD
jgi:hypothetical protein